MALDTIEVSIRIDRAFVSKLDSKTLMQFKLCDPVDLLRLQMCYFIDQTGKRLFKNSLPWEFQPLFELCDIFAAESFSGQIQ